MNIAQQLEEALEDDLLTEETVKEGLTSALKAKDKRKIRKIVTFLMRRGMNDEGVWEMAREFAPGLDRKEWNMLRGMPTITGTPEEASQKAFKGPEAGEKVFDKLKSKQVIWMSWSDYGMGMQSREFRPLQVGRRSKSKKWGTESIHLLRPGTTKSHPISKLTLIKRKDGSVNLAVGDMAGKIHGIWIP